MNSHSIVQIGSTLRTQKYGQLNWSFSHIDIKPLYVAIIQTKKNCLKNKPKSFREHLSFFFFRFWGWILFGLLTVVRATLSSEQSQHRKFVTKTAQKSLTS